MSDYLDTNGLQRVWGKFKENISSYKEIENVDIASFDDGSNLPLKSLKVAIEPQQDLHGYDAPWVGGSGKNKLQTTATSQTVNGVTFTVNSDGTIKATGKATANVWFAIDATNWGSYSTLANKGFNSSLILNGCPSGGSGNTYALGMRSGNSSNLLDAGNGVTITDLDTNTYYPAILIYNGYEIPSGGLLFKPMLRLSTVTDSTFAPYSNICPISGHTEANVVVSPTTSAEDGTTYNIQFKYGDNPLTVYGGSLDVTTGELVVDRAYVDMGTLNYTYEDASTPKVFRATLSPTPKISGYTICSVYKGTSKGVGALDNGELCISGTQAYPFLRIRDDAYTDVTAFKTSVNGQQLVYELATPLTIQLSPTIIKSLQGENNFFASTGEIIKVEYQPDNIVGELRSEIQSLDYDIFIVNCINNNGSWVTDVTESELRKAVNENKKIFMAYKNRLVPFIEMTSYISYPNTATFSCADFGQTDLINNKIGLTKTTLEVSFSDSSVSEDIESLNLQLTV